MTRADRVLSTPPTNTPISQNSPVDQTRRHFLTVTAGASVVSVGTLAVAAMPTAAPDIAACAGDPAFALIRAKREADVLYSWAIEAQDVAEEWQGPSSDAARKADERCYAAGKAVNEIDWKLATTPPTTLAGVVAVLRLANLIEDAGCDWPLTDTIGPDGWHYQLRATMAAAIEALINAQTGKPVQS
jgi:hypothetical protein